MCVFYLSGKAFPMAKGCGEGGCVAGQLLKYSAGVSLSTMFRQILIAPLLKESYFHCTVWLFWLVLVNFECKLRSQKARRHASILQTIMSSSRQFGVFALERQTKFIVLLLCAVSKTISDRFFWMQSLKPGNEGIAKWWKCQQAPSVQLNWHCQK